MPSNTVISAQTLTAGLRADFWDTWQNTYKAVQDRLRDSMELEVPSDKLQEIFGWYDTSPYPRRWPKGDPIQSEPFGSRQFRISNLDWGIRVPWHVNDRADDQTRSLFERARDAGRNWGTLVERVFFQILNNTTDPELLPAIPSAADGAPLYSGVDGEGLPRFGVPGGNTVPQSGLDTGQQVRNDFYAAVARFKQFLDKKGQPLWAQSTINDNGFVVIYNIALERVFAEAFIQSRTVQVIQNIAGTENVAAANVTNVVLEAGLSVLLWGTPRVTTNAWYIFARGVPRKAIIHLRREPLSEVVATMDNSDHTRTTAEEYIQWRSREGFGVNIPYQTIRVA